MGCTNTYFDEENKEEEDDPDKEQPESYWFSFNG